jgi:hypothetical protein
MNAAGQLQVVWDVTGAGGGRPGQGAGRRWPSGPGGQPHADRRAARGRGAAGRRPGPGRRGLPGRRGRRPRRAAALCAVGDRVPPADPTHRRRRRRWGSAGGGRPPGCLRAGGWAQHRDLPAQPTTHKGRSGRCWPSGWWPPTGQAPSGWPLDAPGTPRGRAGPPASSATPVRRGRHRQPGPLAGPHGRVAQPALAPRGGQGADHPGSATASPLAGSGSCPPPSR